ncbi:outer membrane autotransporter barrel domain-containing protein [Pseudomonas sp. 43mfcvi1.1]|uniref:autotransporter outer membrane beta-barrel domain-containing protein n=2 Tax=unclassified Pseudomonas TaxID=196821 RepID=UPI000D6C2DDC|nr:autotransporter outer membrane beta-barrel domain-containing protein [Pseudomonas sp. 43mfcvi1.1]AXP06275.1 autotransporter domain-containing protein [Pseudomonas fluorescens]PWJ39909.1 outer membrane autotransporter protein [Pseudomonas sp. 43mfcvi1.1]SSB95899.1 outer membrane autotransporter barrel domain-containing protein [Pseudomonas sp. 43mfcvi1.1]
MPTQHSFLPQQLALTIALLLGCADVSMALQSTDDATPPTSETATQKQTQPNHSKASLRPPKFTTLEGETPPTIRFNRGLVEASTRFRNLGQMGAEVHVAGEFHNEGSVGKSVFVNETGSFSGHGTVDTLNVKGLLNVDPASGAPTVKKNLELSQSATLLYGIHPESGSATIKVGGTATLGGATLKITSLPGESIGAGKHIVIEAKKVDGEFGKVVNELAFVTAKPDYATEKQVGLTLTLKDVPPKEVAPTPNGQAVLAAILGSGSTQPTQAEPSITSPTPPSPAVEPQADRSASKPTEPAKVVASTQPKPAAQVQAVKPAPKPNAAVNALLGTNMATAADAIDQLGNYNTADLGSATLSSITPISTGMLSAMDRRSPTGAHDNGQVWVQAIGNSGSIGRQLGSYALKHSTKGLMLGTDWAISPDWRLGLIGGKTHTRLDSRQFDGRLDSWLVGAYALRQDGPLALRLGAVYGSHDGSTKRHVAYNGFSDRLKGRYDANTQQVFGQLGYNLNVGHFDVEPYVQVGYQRYQRDRYTEKGGSAALQFSGQSQDNYNSNLGLRLARTLPLDQGMRLTPRLNLGWKHLYGETRGTSRQRLASAGNTYTVEGVELDRDSLLFETGLDLTVSPRHTLGVSYNGETGQDNRNGALMGQWRMTF